MSTRPTPTTTTVTGSEVMVADDDSEAPLIPIEVEGQT
jgi:hypothetical protein